MKSQRGQRRLSTASRVLDIITPILPGHLEPLESLLTEIGKDLRKNSHIDFSKLTTTHFLRWVIVRDGPGERTQHRPLLVFNSNFDGGAERYLDDLIAQAGQGLREIYRYCGYPANGTQDSDVALKEYLRRATQGRCAAFYEGYPHLSVRSIRNNAAVWALVDQLLDSYWKDHASRPLSPHEQQEAFQQLHATIQQRLAAGPGLLRDDDRPSSTRLGRVLGRLARSHTVRLGLVFCALPVLLPVGLLALGASLGLWRKEQRDAEEPKTVDDVDEQLIEREDFQVQNQMTHVTEIKPGMLRWLVLRAVLASINLLARHYYTHGQLGSIQSIHFAGWLFIEDRRLLFFSNYDGNWESYLDEFIDRASIGLTSVWSNTQGFPKTGWLCLWGGSRRAASFKQWTRDHQITTQVWYSAHPDKSLQNILADRDFCAQARTMTPADLREWLPHF